MGGAGNVTEMLQGIFQGTLITPGFLPHAFKCMGRNEAFKSLEKNKEAFHLCAGQAFGHIYNSLSAIR